MSPQQGTVKVRVLNYEDVLQLAAGERIDGYHVEHDGMEPVSIKARGRHNGDYSKPVYPGQETRPERDDIHAEPLGYRVQVDTQTMFGTSSGATFFTTPEAEARADFKGEYTGSAADHRRRFGIADEDGEEHPLVPVYGCQVSLTMFMPDVDHVEAKERAMAALRKEFGQDDTLHIHRPSSRPVADRRVNVKSYASGMKEKVVALNVLEAEAYYYAQSGSYTTEYVGREVTIGR